MKDSTLLKISLCCSLIGILLILFITENTEIKKIDIDKITTQNIDYPVAIEGKIKNVINTPGLYILDVYDETGSITTIVFKENENLTIQKEQKVRIEGKVTEYNGELEIQADLIRKKVI